jgi:hypothetical protein
VSPFQLFGIGISGVAIAATLRSYLRGRSGRLATACWSALWLGAGVAIAEPRTTVWVARALGIGRGADLVLYCSVLAVSLGFFLVYARLRQLESHLTLVVRHLALRDAETRPERVPRGEGTG